MSLWPRDGLRLRAVDGVYVRRFERGVALVNPDTVPHTYAVPGALRVVTPYGGGSLRPDADTSSMGLRLRDAGPTLRLGPRSGAVLVG